MSAKSTPLPRGKTHDANTLPHALGLQKEFADVNWGSSESVKPTLSGSIVLCEYVKNNSGGALLPGQLVYYEDGYCGKYVKGVATATQLADGVVDEYLPAAGVADGKHFWIVKRGYTKLINSSATAIDQGDWLKTAAAGEVAEDSGTPVTNFCVGRAAEIVAATENLKFRAKVNLDR